MVGLAARVTVVAAPLSRRTTLGAVGASGLAAALSACDAGDLDPRSEPATPTVTETLVQPAPADEKADGETLVQVLSETAAVLALVEAVAAQHPSLRARLTPLAAMHRAHHDLLLGAAEDAEADSAPQVPVPARPPAAMRLLRSTEETTRGRYQGWALEARSGAFARLLASMSAAVGQRLDADADGAP